MNNEGIAKPQSLDQYYKQLSSIYDPQRQFVNTQMAQVPQQFTAQKSALEQAKINAFRDIANQSSARGAGWSGFRPGEEATYVGEKYLPALAGLEREQTAQMTALQKALLDVGSEQSLTARGYFEDADKLYKSQMFTSKQSKIERQFTEEQNKISRDFDKKMKELQNKWDMAAIDKKAAIERQMTKEQNNFTAQQNALDRQHQANLQAAQTAASTPPAAAQYKATTNKNSKGEPTGTSFYGPYGAPVTAAQYVSGIGGSIDNLYTILASDYDPTGKKAAADLKKAGGLTPELVNKYPWIFGG
jgi:hypothetical protein